MGKGGGMWGYSRLVSPFLVSYPSKVFLRNSTEKFFFLQATREPRIGVGSPVIGERTKVSGVALCSIGFPFAQAAVTFLVLTLSRLGRSGEGRLETITP